MKLVRTLLPSLVGVGLTLLAGSDAHACAPGDLIGTWEVEHVLVDRANQMGWEMRPDNPSMLFRRLTISEREVRFADAPPCEQTQWKPSTTTWGALFRKGFQRTPGPSRSTRSVPEDYGLSVSMRDSVKAYVLCSARKESKPWLNGEWVAPKDADTLVMHYSDRVLLTLRRVPAGARTRASFPCEQASSAAQKQICSDPELAGWDRSVAEGLRQSMAWQPDRAKELIQEQQHWQDERDACAADTKCLLDSMRERTAELAVQ